MANSLADGWELGRNTRGKLVKRSEKKVYKKNFQTGSGFGDICAHENSHQKQLQQRRILIIKWLK